MEKAHGQSSKGDSCILSHDEHAQGDLCSGQRPKGRSSSNAPNSKAETDEGREKSSIIGQEGSSSDKRSKIPCRYKNCQSPSCKIWHPPVCHNNKSETRCIYGRKCFFRHVEAEEKPKKKSKKDGSKGSVALLKKGVYTIGLCISRFLSEKVFST